MENNDTQTKLNSLDSKIEGIKSSISPIKENLKKALILLIVKWSDQFETNTVSKNADLIKSFNEDKIKKLHEDLDSTKSAIIEGISTTLNSLIWISDLTHSTFTNHEKQGQVFSCFVLTDSFFNQFLNELCRNLNNEIEKYINCFRDSKFKIDSKKDAINISYDSINDSLSLTKDSSFILKFNYGIISFNDLERAEDQLKKILAKYLIFVKEYFELEIKYDELKNELNSEEALNLWNNTK